MLKSSEQYAQKHDIVLNPGKTRCMHFARGNAASGSVSFMNTNLADIDHSMVQFNIKCMRILLDLKNLQCDFNLLSRCI